jgi:putative membrane protein insertion efficiency factor
MWLDSVLSRRRHRVRQAQARAASAQQPPHGYFEQQANYLNQQRPPESKKKRKSRDVSDCCDCGDCDLPCGFDLMLVLVPLLRLVAPDATRARRTPSVPARAGLAAIRGYQRGISAHLPARCRYTPTCSEYGAQAVQRFGLLTGSRLTAERIARCTHGIPHGTPDPVPGVSAGR